MIDASGRNRASSSRYAVITATKLEEAIVGLNLRRDASPRSAKKMLQHGLIRHEVQQRHRVDFGLMTGC